MEASPHFGGEEIQKETVLLGVGVVAADGMGVRLRLVEDDFDEPDEENDTYPFTTSGARWTTADDMVSKLRTGRTRQREYRYDEYGRIVGVIQ